MAKGSDEKKSQRLIRILQLIFRRRIVPIDELKTLLKTEFNVKDVRTIKNDVNELEARRFPVQISSKNLVLSPVHLDTLWEGTDVGERLSDIKSMKNKQKLSKRLISFLKKNKKEYPINSVLFGSGVTAYCCFSQWLANLEECRFDTIYTANVLVLQAFIYNKHHDITLRIVGGDLDRETACLRSEKGVEALSMTTADAVVTSFKELSEKGFTTKQEWEIPEKYVNLLPSKHTNLVIIPIELSKVGRQDGHLVEGVRENKSYGLEEILKDRGDRRYVVITEKSRNIAIKKSPLLCMWEQNGLEIF